MNALQSSEPYRHEYKYAINSHQLETLRSRLPIIMSYDRHSGESGQYNIRSLYFDDLEDSGYYDKENGTDPREKFRIRIYNASSDFIRLELKRKDRGKTLKTACTLTKEQAEAMIEGKGISWDDKMHPLLKRFYVLQETVNLKPKVIVEYERIPFVYEAGNVRATLDLDIRTTADIKSFFDKQTSCRPIMPKGVNLLEVKFDEFLPDYIYQTLQLNHLQQVTFSKYYLCRKFGGITL
jgi:hypothetical protein